MAVLFIEIGCEEIPARLQKKAIADLEGLLRLALADKGFTANASRSAISPRHMAVELDGLADRLEDTRATRRGPRLDAPQKAIDGFCHSTGLNQDQLTIQNTPKGDFYFAQIDNKGAVLRESVASLLISVLSTFPWPKSQRWAYSRMVWVRPLTSINALIDGQPITGEIDLGGGMSLAFGSTTNGHPFYADSPISLSDFDAYKANMRAGFVIIDQNERRQLIKEQLDNLAAQKGLKLVDDAYLLDEVTGLVEWPNAILGQIDDDFMSLPAEVLVMSMRVHQKYFALSKTGNIDNLAPFFITVANRQADAKNDRLIVAGNERVLRARLADARFFWEHNVKEKIDKNVDALSSVTFFHGLGTLEQKALRLADLSEFIASSIQGADSPIARRAGLLAKTDLISSMVGEFPELQGIMGGHYARRAGEDESVAIAISEHYRPQGPADPIPQSPIGLAVSLADKIDTLVGFFAIDAKPTGSRDPYALRRAALGVLRMIDEADLPLNLDDILLKSTMLYKDQQPDPALPGLVFDQPDADLPGFILERLRVRLRGKGIPHDVIAAALGHMGSGMSGQAGAPIADGNNQKGGEARIGNVRHLIKICEALDKFLRTDEGAHLATGWRRVSSLLQAEEKKQGSISDKITADLFENDAERELFAALLSQSKEEDLKIPRDSLDDISRDIEALGKLSGPINRFFEEVIVNSDNKDIRQNRLALLLRARAEMLKFADFSQLEG